MRVTLNASGIYFIMPWTNGLELSVFFLTCDGPAAPLLLGDGWIDFYKGRCFSEIHLSFVD